MGTDHLFRDFLILRAFRQGRQLSPSPETREGRRSNSDRRELPAPGVTQLLLSFRQTGSKWQLQNASILNCQFQLKQIVDGLLRGSGGIVPRSIGTTKLVAKILETPSPTGRSDCLHQRVFDAFVFRDAFELLDHRLTQLSKNIR
jgi:hypothetical protein